MITVSKGHAQNAETFRLALTCDQCHAHVETDVPLHNIRDQGDAATDPYLERARLELALICPHMQAEIRLHTKEAQPSPQEGWDTPQRRPSSYTDHS